MKTFNFTTTDHELTLREIGDMRHAVMAQVAPVQAASVWARLAHTFTPFTQLAARPAFAGAFALVLMVSAGGYALLRTGETQSDVLAREVGTATTTVLAVLDTPSIPMVAHESMDATTSARMATSMGASEARIATLADTAVQVTAGAIVPKEVTDALAVIDSALTGSSVAADVPLARIVASLATLQSVAETHVEEGTAGAADEAVLAFIADKKPLLSLLVSTASDSEKLAIHTAASEFILADVRATDATQGVFAESFLATRDTDDTTDLLDDLSTVKAVASMAVPKI